MQRLALRCQPFVFKAHACCSPTSEYLVCTVTPSGRWVGRTAIRLRLSLYVCKHFLTINSAPSNAKVGSCYVPASCGKQCVRPPFSSVLPSSWPRRKRCNRRQRLRAWCVRSAQSPRSKGSAITLKADNGAEVNVLVQESARVLRTAPGQQDLKDATIITLQDLQVGDRILVRGQVGDDGKSVLAASVIAIKKTDLAEKHQRDLQDWQRRRDRRTGEGGRPHCRNR